MSVLLYLVIPWVYLAISFATAWASISVLMEKKICEKDHYGDSKCLLNKFKCHVPIGELRERNMGDACKAIGIGFIWPIAIPMALLLKSAPLGLSELKRLSDQ